MNICAICGKPQEEVITCELCGKRVCLDCVIYKENAPDDGKYTCISCEEGDDNV